MPFVSRRLASRGLTALRGLRQNVQTQSHRHILLTEPISGRPAACSSLGLRWNSTSARSGSTSSPSSGSFLAAVLGASVFSGLAGFFYARRSLSNSSSPIDTLANPQYGSPDDYQRGIEELRAVLPEDMVSTNPEDLLVHGMSANVWHPGR